MKLKRYTCLLALNLLAVLAYGQDFTKNLSSARTAYASGNLSQSRFAMEQMLRELDGAIAKEVLKLLPTKMDALAANIQDDNTTATGSYLGLYVQRSYGKAGKTATVDVVNNSPLITSLNALLAIPFVANAGDGSQKVVRIQGFKAVMHKNQDSSTGKLDYDLQIPMQNTLVTFKMEDTKEADMIRLANTLPLEKIAALAK
ncbi:MAG: hypothetical protein ACO1NZ_18485 [Adhaeribacter sp.]